MDDDSATLGAYLHDWHERRRTQLRPSTHKSYAQLIRCYLVPHLGEVALMDLTRPRIEQVYARLLTSGGRRGRPLAPKTVRYCHTVLRKALEDARIDGLVTTNVAEEARAPRHDPAHDQLDDDLQVCGQVITLPQDLVLDEAVPPGKRVVEQVEGDAQVVGEIDDLPTRRPRANTV